MGEAVVEVVVVFMPDEESPIIVEPTLLARQLSAMAAPSQLASVLLRRSFAVLAMGTDPFDARFRQPISQSIAVGAPLEFVSLGIFDARVATSVLP